MLTTTEHAHTEEPVEKEISQPLAAVIRTLLYFDIFQYPLTADEVQEYCNRYVLSKKEIIAGLEACEKAGYVSSRDGFYLIANSGIESLIHRRLKGNKEAAKFLKVAKRFSRFIACFPFVRGICLSGSLSKGYADGDSDIDYFIITQPGRLWVTRTLLVMFKKVFLFNSHKYFCVNYFIDTNNLEIPDRNLFAATELLSIIPTYNAELYIGLMHANNWIKEYLPNGSLKTDKYPVRRLNRNIIRRATEVSLNGKVGDKLDEICFRFTLSAWKRKFRHFNAAEFDLNMRTRKDVSKHHPNGFQLKVMRAYNEKIRSFEKRFNISLD